MLNSISRRVRAAMTVVAVLAAACSHPSRVTPPPGTTVVPAPATPSISITDGESLIRAMHAKYANRWFHTMTLIRQTTLTLPSGTPSEQSWYVALWLPGLERIDYGNPENGNGVLFRSDSNYQFSGGRLARTSTGWNDEVLLSFDVYLQPPEVTISILRSQGYQLSRMRTASFDGKSAFVVGAANQSDTTSKQFWIERDRLVFVRTMERRADGRHSDIRLGDFTQAGGGWIAKQTYQLVDGQVRVHQQNSNIKVDPPLDTALFDPKQWATVKHWSKP